MSFKKSWIFEAIERRRYQLVARALKRTPALANEVWIEKQGRNDEEIHHPAFFSALFERDLKLIDAFLNVSVLDKNLKGYDQKNAVSYMAYEDADLPIVQKLVENGFAFDEPGFCGRTPAMTCLLSARGYRTFDYLVSCGADLTAADWDGNTLVHLAAMQPDDRYIRRLEKEIETCVFGDKEALYRMKNKAGRTPAHEAIMAGRYDTADRLAQKTPDFQYVDERNRCLVGDDIKARSAFHEIKSRCRDCRKPETIVVHRSVSLDWKSNTREIA